MICKTHKMYYGKRQPKVDCLECWKIYAERLESNVETLTRNIQYLATERVEMCGICASKGE